MQKEKTPAEMLFERAQYAKGDKAVQTLPVQDYVSAKGSTYASFYYFDMQFKRQPPSNISSTKHT